jgi:hypothetical protein
MSENKNNIEIKFRSPEGNELKTLPDFPSYLKSESLETRVKAECLLVKAVFKGLVCLTKEVQDPIEIYSNKNNDLHRRIDEVIASYSLRNFDKEPISLVQNTTYATDTRDLFCLYLAVNGLLNGKVTWAQTYLLQGNEQPLPDDKQQKSLSYDAIKEALPLIMKGLHYKGMCQHQTVKQYLIHRDPGTWITYHATNMANEHIPLMIAVRSDKSFAHVEINSKQLEGIKAGKSAMELWPETTHQQIAELAKAVIELQEVADIKPMIAPPVWTSSLQISSSHVAATNSSPGFIPGK